jgi:hypothetical protein
MIGATTEFDPRRLPLVSVTLCNRSPLRLELVVRPEAVESVRSWFGEPEFYDPPDPRRSDLLCISETIDVLRFLMHPVAGHDEPLGRRLHPMGGFALSMALSAAGGTPRRAKLRWHKPVELGSGYHADRSNNIIRIRDAAGTLVASAEVVSKA